MNLKVNKILQVLLIGVMVVVMLLKAFDDKVGSWTFLVAVICLIGFGILRFGFYRCPSCRKFLGKSHKAFCTNCGHEIIGDDCFP